MAEKEKMLRGKAPLTMYRGSSGPGGHLYRGSVIDPGLVDEDDAKRLIADGFVELVVRDGESWKVADGDDKGKPVTVGDVAVKDPNEPDNGTVNVVAKPDKDPEGEARRTAARQKLAESGGVPHGNASKDVWVEYAVAQGMDRVEAEKADRADLASALKK